MVDIIPAVLVRTYKELNDSLERIRGIAPLVQIDVVDGMFAPTTTWPYGDEARFDSIVVGDEGLPLWDNFDYEFDLMLQNPAEEVGLYVSAGASRIVLHARSARVEEALHILQSARLSDALPVQVGIALRVSDEPSVLDEFENQFDYIQVMGIEHLGIQGQEISSDAIPFIKQLRFLHPEKAIQVDGGVRKDNALALARAGANRLIAGSAVFSSSDPSVAYGALKREANR